MLSAHTTLGFLLLASAAIIAIVLGAQYIGGLMPCELCLYERWAYYATMTVTVLGLAFAGRSPALTRFLLWLVALIFAASIVLSAYHVGVEQHWIAGPTACTGGLGQANSPEELMKLLEAKQAVQCDVVQWSFHGVSLAGLNLIASLVLFAVAFRAARQGRRR